MRFLPRHLAQRLTAASTAALPALAGAQGFDKITTTVTSIQTLMVTISVAVVTIAVIWAGFKMDPLAWTFLAPAHGRAGGGHGPFPGGKGWGMGERT